MKTNTLPPQEIYDVLHAAEAAGVELPLSVDAWWKLETALNETANKKTGRLVILEGIEHHNRFFSSYTPGKDPTKSATGETWYKILGYADSVAEAQMFLYGRVFS